MNPKSIVMLFQTYRFTVRFPDTCFAMGSDCHVPDYVLATPSEDVGPSPTAE